MLMAVEGVYRNGKVELLEPGPPVAEARVIVAFIAPEREVDLRERDVDEDQASSLKTRLALVERDWNRPEMDVYDAL